MTFRHLALLTALLPASAYPQMTATDAPGRSPIHIRVAPLPTPQTIPDSVFGSFLEPIGHSTYGGLWADVVENPSFESGLWSAGNINSMVKERPELREASELGLPLPWEPLDRTQGNRYAPLRATPTNEVPNSSQSLLVMALPGATPKQETGILQRVYLPAQRELSYTGSLWVKHVRGGTGVSISLRRHNHPEEVLAQTSLDAASATWTKLPFQLALQPNAVQPLEPVDLVISLKDGARAEFDNVNLFPADAVDGMDPDELALARDLHSPLIRFGGNFTSGYDWHDGIGPSDKRVSMRNVSWGIPEYNTFGTDEFLRFCNLIHGRPQVALNLGTGTPEQAADWVQYIDKKWQHTGLLWELGNELWGNWQIGYPSQDEVGQLTASFSKAVRAVDPQAKLIATGADPDHFHDWDAVQFASAPDTFNYISTHFVVGDAVELRNPPADFRTMAALALPIGLAERLKAIRQQAVDAHHPEVKVAFTEWLMISDDHAGPSYTNMGGALFAGGFLNMIMRNTDVVPISDMTGIMEFGGIWKKRGQVYAAPAYWVLREYAAAAPRTLLAATITDAPAYTVTHGNKRIPEIASVPFLDVTAALSSDGKHLLLFCVNRHLTDALSAQFDLAALGRPGETAEVSTLRADSILQANDEEDPNLVVPRHATQAITPQFTHTFPAESVTVLDIPVTR